MSEVSTTWAHILPYNKRSSLIELSTAGAVAHMGQSYSMVLCKTWRVKQPHTLFI